MSFYPARSISAIPGLAADTRGAATVELALILPVVVALLALSAVGGEGFSIDRKVVLAAHTVTDLVSGTPYESGSTTTGATQIKQSELDINLALSAEILYPNDPGTLQMVVSELQVNPTTNMGTVIWSEPYNGGTALANGTQVPLDPSYSQTGAPYLIYGQASYTFQPLGIIYPAGLMTLTSTEMLTVRNGGQITVLWGS